MAAALESINQKRAFVRAGGPLCLRDPLGVRFHRGADGPALCGARELRHAPLRPQRDRADGHRVRRPGLLAAQRQGLGGQFRGRHPDAGCLCRRRFLVDQAWPFAGGRCLDFRAATAFDGGFGRPAAGGDRLPHTLDRHRHRLSRGRARAASKPVGGGSRLAPGRMRLPRRHGGHHARHDLAEADRGQD